MSSASTKIFENEMEIFENETDEDLLRSIMHSLVIRERFEVEPKYLEEFKHLVDSIENLSKDPDSPFEAVLKDIKAKGENNPVLEKAKDFDIPVLKQFRDSIAATPEDKPIPSPFPPPFSCFDPASETHDLKCVPNFDDLFREQCIRYRVLTCSGIPATAYKRMSPRASRCHNCMLEMIRSSPSRSWRPLVRPPSLLTLHGLVAYSLGRDSLQGSGLHASFVKNSTGSKTKRDDTEMIDDDSTKPASSKDYMAKLEEDLTDKLKPDSRLRRQYKQHRTVSEPFLSQYSAVRAREVRGRSTSMVRTMTPSNLDLILQRRRREQRRGRSPDAAGNRSRSQNGLDDRGSSQEHSPRENEAPVSDSVLNDLCGRLGDVKVGLPEEDDLMEDLVSALKSFPTDDTNMKMEEED
ncbi:hypothetical protein BU24DRAFT_455935 [Aaosphaeria arxii CBS 175.79]|uniref:Uncharacterized protein n=1 Tax=Aaosphaeria arxii CBS 175.79 TaxID=1450172 RepID=A0A6A5X7L4_9PLEO|nr:uncharacterized protein BU24DRAFT_455935 [Aaosphaeria arxii CBS 175.79]KAF2009015.1 hypothetical protein BU24DRAFT_455935 [Aaosphaeria arxii CBS 175.79]